MNIAGGLETSENFFYKVFQQNQVMMAITEIMTGKFIDVNQEFLKNLEYEKKEVIGKTFFNLNFYPDPIQRNMYLARFLNGETFEKEEITFISKNNRILKCKFSLLTVEIDNKSYFLITITNITNLKDIEAELKRNLDSQMIILNVSQRLNKLADPADGFDDILAYIGKKTGVSRIYIFEDNTEKNTTSNTHEWCDKDIKSQIDSLQNISYDKIPSWQSILSSQGMIKSSDINLLPDDLSSLLNAQGIKAILVFPLIVLGNYFGFVGFDNCKNNRDWASELVKTLHIISQMFSNTFKRIGAHKELNESRAQFKMAIDSTGLGIWDWHIPSGAVYFNDQWIQMLGYERDDIVPHVSSWKKLIHPEDLPTVERILKKHLKGKNKIYETTQRLLCSDGSYKWIIDRGRVIERDDRGNPIRAIGTHSDANELITLTEELKKANATRDKFFSIIAHDLRGPIGNLMQISEYISVKGRVNEKTLYEFLDSQKDLSKRTYNLLENLLHWASYNSSKIKLLRVAFDVNEIIEKCIEDFRYQSVIKNISIETPCRESALVFADINMTKFVIRNILSNALKFTPEKGIITIDVNKSFSEFTTVAVSDTGSGIHPENIKKIFSESQFYSTPGTNSEKGSGLGLKLCKNFVRLNGGEFKIDNKNKYRPETGAVISFSLPVNE